MSGSAFRRSVAVWVDQSLSPAAQAKHLARVARDGRDDLIRSGRSPSAYLTVVDGAEGASEDGVQAGGVIVYRFNLLGQAAVYAMDYLRQRAPQGPPKKLRDGAHAFAGHYRDQFVYAIGERMTKFRRRQVQAEQYTAARIIRRESFDPQRVEGDVAEILIVNRSPYARKVDVQLAGNRRLKFDVPANLFEDAAAAVRRRFPTLEARRIYQAHFPNQYLIKIPQYRKGTQRFARRVGTPVENPALVISVG